MNLKSLISNIAYAFSAQGLSFLLSIMTSLLVPKMLGIEEFGYWQLFLFYGSYVGFFLLGLNDGIYLIHGGERREEIDQRSIGSQLLLSMIVQCFVSVAIGLFALSQADDQNRQFVILSVAAYLLLYNSVGFFSYLFQSLNETKLSSLSIAIDRVSFLFPLAVLLILNCSDFRIYIIFYLVARSVSLIYCILKAKEFIFVKPYHIRATIKYCWESISVGIKLMLANIASMLILGIMRFVVDGCWGIEVFGEISFSLTMVNFFSTFVIQIAMVLFPALRQSSPAALKKVFEAGRDALELLFPLVYLLYFPAKWLMVIWLPQYASSIIWFAFFLPLCVFDAKMSIIGTTYFKVMRKEKTLLMLNVATVIFSTIGVIVGAYLFNSLEIVICSAVIAIALRSLVAEWLVSDYLDTQKSHIVFGEFAFSVIFVIVAALFDGYFGILAVAVSYILYILIYRRQAQKMLTGAINLLRKK